MFLYLLFYCFVLRFWSGSPWVNTTLFFLFWGGGEEQVSHVHRQSAHAHPGPGAHPRHAPCPGWGRGRPLVCGALPTPRRHPSRASCACPCFYGVLIGGWPVWSFHVDSEVSQRPGPAASGCGRLDAASRPHAAVEHRKKSALVSSVNPSPRSSGSFRFPSFFPLPLELSFWVQCVRRLLHPAVPWFPAFLPTLMLICSVISLLPCFHHGPPWGSVTPEGCCVPFGPCTCSAVPVGTSAEQASGV